MYSVLVVDDEIRQREAVIKSVNWEKAGFKVVGDAENGISFAVAFRNRRGYLYTSRVERQCQKVRTY